MDVLVNKSKRFYDYTSRYATFPYYYHTIDKKYVYGITNNLREDTEYVIHMIKDTDTLDSLALKYYGRPDLFWIIADFNGITDSYTKLIDNYNFLNIPTLAGIRYKD